MKNVLLVGDANPDTRNYQRFRALKDIGKKLQYKTIMLSSMPNSLFPFENKKNLYYRIRNKLGFPIDEVKINQNILEKVAIIKPSLIWIDKGTLIHKKTLISIKKICPEAKLIQWLPEYIKPRHNRSFYTLQSLGLYDTILSPMIQNCECQWLRQQGAKDVICLNQGYDKYLHHPVQLSDIEQEQLVTDVGFIGTFELDRAKKMLYLAESGIQVRVWGDGWKKWIDKHPNLIIKNKPLYGKDYIKAICANKINLCFLRKANQDRQTSRTLEITACGGFMLAERTDEHEKLFKDGEEAIFFDINKPEELLQKVTYYLQNDQERKTIAKKGRERCLAGRYSYHEILCPILQQILELL